MSTGYYTSFYTGGRLQFDNVEAYLHAAGVQKMVGEDQFASLTKRTVWGAYDEETLALHLQRIARKRCHNLSFRHLPHILHMNGMMQMCRNSLYQGCRQGKRQLPQYHALC
jgi:hypothetical protein